MLNYYPRVPNFTRFALRLLIFQKIEGFFFIGHNGELAIFENNSLKSETQNCKNPQPIFVRAIAGKIHEKFEHFLLRFVGGVAF